MKLHKYNNKPEEGNNGVIRNGAGSFNILLFYSKEYRLMRLVFAIPPPPVSSDSHSGERVEWKQY
jgi:hypothetical protein